MKTNSMMSLPLVASPKHEDSKPGQLTNWMTHLERAWLDQWPVAPVPPLTTIAEALPTNAGVAVDSAKVSTTENPTQTPHAEGLTQAPQTSQPTAENDGDGEAKSSPSTATHGQPSPQAQNVAALTGKGSWTQDGTAAPRDLGLGRAVFLQRPVTLAPVSLDRLAPVSSVSSEAAALARQQLPLMPSQTAAQADTLLAVPLRLTELPHATAAPASGESAPDGRSAQEAAREVSKPYAPSLLRVSVTEASVQVTLRDASLSHTAALLAGSAIAQQLRARGAEGLRVYVNGQRTDMPAGQVAAATDSANRVPVFEPEPPKFM